MTRAIWLWLMVTSTGFVAAEMVVHYVDRRSARTGLDDCVAACAPAQLALYERDQACYCRVDP